jgi:hypothetical protein
MWAKLYRVAATRSTTLSTRYRNTSPTQDWGVRSESCDPAYPAEPRGSPPNARQTAKQSGEFITFSGWLVKLRTEVIGLRVRIGEQMVTCQSILGRRRKRVTLEWIDLRRDHEHGSYTSRAAAGRCCLVRIGRTATRLEARGSRGNLPDAAHRIGVSSAKRAPSIACAGPRTNLPTDFD